jgi:phosphoglucosamine mutase
MTSRRYFGTDGVRGAYGGPVINESFAARLGAAAAAWLGATAGGDPPVVLIGRDTRFSGAALERALARGLASRGARPRSLGIVPTPAVARAVRHQGAALGVVVTASHNPAEDNGIKFFAASGRKLTDEDEAAIEALLPAEGGTDGASPGSLSEQTDAAEDYRTAAGALLPAGALRGWPIVVDTGNGATVGTSPAVLAGLGAEVMGIGDRPDGHNINAGVGSEHPEAMVARVRAAGARLGIAHDGDGDRCVLCDERGETLDGDEILTLLATRALAADTLAERTLVVTVQSNLGVDAAVAAAGGRVVRTAVGDRYVVEGMEQTGANLGGESSGHIVCREIALTGDGLVAALRVIAIMRASGQPLSVLRRVLKKFPQVSSAVPVREKRPLADLANLAAAVRRVEAELDGRGRVLVRYSGTEPKLRLTVEGPDAAAVRAGLVALEAAARRDLG